MGGSSLCEWTVVCKSEVEHGSLVQCFISSQYSPLPKRGQNLLKIKAKVIKPSASSRENVKIKHI